MAKAIWKFPLEITDEQQIKVSRYSKPLHVGFQAGALCLWVETSPDEPVKFMRKVRIYGTGHNMAETSSEFYIGTAVDEAHRLVWHVYMDENVGVA